MIYAPYFNTAGGEDVGTHYQLSPMSVARYQTRATSVDITLYNNAFGTAQLHCDVAVYIDGAYIASVSATEEGYKTETVALGDGDKLVELMNGSQTIASPNLGTWITKAIFNESASVVAESVSLCVYGDSIANGATASPRLENGWVPLVGVGLGKFAQLHGYGGASLRADALSDAQLETLVSQLCINDPPTIWLAIGTNDYFESVWDSADFGARYDDLLVSLNDRLPSATVYAQSPIVRAVETANSLGDTLGDYRSAISSAASGKGWVTYVDGSSIITTGDLDGGGVHPTTAGHAAIASYVLGVL